jgi:hypothetical protein
MNPCDKNSAKHNAPFQFKESFVCEDEVVAIERCSDC